MGVAYLAGMVTAGIVSCCRAGPTVFPSLSLCRRRRETLLVLLAGICRAVAILLYICARGVLVGVVYITVGLTGGPVRVQGVFSILSLSWPLAVNLYRQLTSAVVETVESSVAVSRMQVRSCGHVSSVKPYVWQAVLKPGFLYPAPDYP